MSTPYRPVWIKSGLFWRTFFLLGFLIATSMAAWVASFRVVEQTPRANQIAAQVISIVTITRAALTHSAPDLRRELLFDLASNEGIRIYPLEDTDHVEPPVDTGMMQSIEQTIRDGLGPDTRFARTVNDVSGFWVSFTIADDEYWLMLDRSRIDGSSGIQWLGWGAATLLLSLIGAMIISGLINQPLARLAAAARSVANGGRPDPLPERGPREIREANHSFNQMVDDLNRVESDRTLILAGISHDLRTPLTRMQLELEMAGLPEQAREGMRSDLEQMDDIIGQFLDYARPSESGNFATVDVSELLAEAAQEAARSPDLRVSTEIEAHLEILGHAVDLKRVFNNLIENARRYGRTPNCPYTDIALCGRAEGGHVTVEVNDCGAGVPEGEVDRLLRPFTRMDSARGQANGAGLGLAIVHRIVLRHGATLQMQNRSEGGLCVRIVFPNAKKTRLHLPS